MGQAAVYIQIKVLDLFLKSAQTKCNGSYIDKPTTVSFQILSNQFLTNGC
jgi:hypothetical protein